MKCGKNTLSSCFSFVLISVLLLSISNKKSQICKNMKKNKGLPIKNKNKKTTKKKSLLKLLCWINILTKQYKVILKD